MTGEDDRGWVDDGGRAKMDDGGKVWVIKDRGR